MTSREQSPSSDATGEPTSPPPPPLLPPSAPPTEKEREGGFLVIGIVVALLLLLAGGYYGAYAYAGDKVPRGTTVSGVDVGGLTRAEAEAHLEEAFADRAGQEIEVSVKADPEVDGADEGGEPRTATVKPEDIGLDVDEAASVEAAGAGRSWTPARQWDYFTGGDEVEAVVDVDESLLDVELAELSEGLGTPPENGEVNFSDNKVTTVDPVVGEEIDLEAARAAITDAYLGEEDTAELTVAPAEPDIDDADVEQALNEFANPAMSGPVTLVFGDNKVRLFPKDYGKALSMVPEDGGLVPQVKAKVITRLVKAATSSDKPVDATVAIVKGKPKVIPAKPGVSFETEDVLDVFLEVLTQPENKREAEVKAEVEEADFTTKEAKALGIKEKVSEFTTHYPHADYRNVNIGRAAELVDGTLLKPGEEFSLNETVGERTAENGFTIGYTIQDGVLVKDYGGGVSQMATTTFNAMFFAGLKDIEHKPHSFYIDRYPVGREATVAWGAVDLRFRNDTKYGVLIEAHVSPSTPSTQGVVTVSMWSTKVWDVTATTSDRYNATSPATRVLRTEDCYPNEGYGGFDVDVTRHFRKPGSATVDHSETFHTRYIPSDTVVCKPPLG